MKIQLIDNRYNEIYELNDDANYGEIWRRIDTIVSNKKYSCEGYTIPKIDKSQKTITIHWIELLGTVSDPCIQILDCTDEIIKRFESKINYNIKRNNTLRHRKERRIV